MPYLVLGLLVLSMACGNRHPQTTLTHTDPSAKVHPDSPDSLVQQGSPFSVVDTSLTVQEKLDAEEISEAVDALSLYDDDGDGYITCTEAHKHGITPVHKGDPAYPFMDDKDGDGVVCE